MQVIQGDKIYSLIWEMVIKWNYKSSELMMPGIRAVTEKHGYHEHTVTTSWDSGRVPRGNDL